MVKRAKYGENAVLARKLGVSPAYVGEVRKRMRRGDTNFYSDTSKRIYRALLRADRIRPEDGGGHSS